MINSTMAGNLNPALISEPMATTLVQNTTIARNTNIPPAATDCSGLGPFKDDGTPGSGYYPLLPSSRAIDAGNDAVCPEADQIGQPRGERCTIGAITFPR